MSDKNLVLINYRDTQDFKDEMEIHSNKYGYGSLANFIRKSARMMIKLDKDPSFIWVKTK